MKRLIIAAILICSPVFGQWVTLPPGNASPLTTKGDLYGFSTKNARFPACTNGQTIQWDSTQTLGAKCVNFPAGTGNVTDINLDATASQTLTVGTTGTDFAIVDNGTGDHKFNLPNASATARGLVSTGAQTLAGAKTFSSAPVLSPLTASLVACTDSGKALTSTCTGLIPWADIATGNNYRLIATNGSGVPSEVAAITASKGLCSDANGIPVACASGPSATEMTYITGLTSSAQTQITAKAPSASPTFTGTVTLPTTAGALVTDSGGVLSKVAPGTNGNVLTSNGTAWISAASGGGGSFLPLAAGSGSPLTGDLYMAQGSVANAAIRFVSGSQFALGNVRNSDSALLPVMWWDSSVATTISGKNQSSSFGIRFHQNGVFVQNQNLGFDPDNTQDLGTNDLGNVMQRPRDLVLGRGLRINNNSNGTFGVATLAGTPGTVTVTNSYVASTDEIFLTVATKGGTQGFLSYTISNGTSFTINSTANETSTVNWLIIRPN